MSQVIVCAHRWIEEHTFIREKEDGTEEKGWWKSCRLCEVTAYDNRPIPRVIIGRIEDE